MRLALIAALSLLASPALAATPDSWNALDTAARLVRPQRQQDELRQERR